MGILKTKFTSKRVFLGFYFKSLLLWHTISLSLFYDMRIIMGEKGEERVDEGGRGEKKK